MHLPALHMSAANQSLLTIILLGATAGWIAARFIQAHGLGTLGDIIPG